MEKIENIDYKAVFHENEIEANKYVAKCMRVMALVVALVWVLNILGVFIVDQDIMVLAAMGSIVFFLLPTLFCKVLKDESRYVKIYNMGCCIGAITLIAAAMPKHGIVVWAAPIALSCHYYSKRFTYGTLIASIICMGIGMFLGAHYGEWDVALFVDITMKPDRIFTPQIYRRLFVFMFLPRALILSGISAVCTTLADRTHGLLEKQIRDNSEKQRIASELDVATRIQASMLPCIFPAFPERDEFEIYATMNPAKEVGGDFYDFFMVDEDNLAIVMADVSGKGVPAALFMVIGKTLIKDHTTSGKDLGEVFTEVNRLLCESNSEELFITAFVGVLNLRSGELRYVNAGHEIPFICKKDGVFTPYKIKAGFVLAGMEGMKYKAGSLQMEPGDKLFQYTDGVTEAMDKDNKLYGMKRLEEILSGVAKKEPKEILESVKEDIDAFAGDTPQFDDITMLCVEYFGKKDEKMGVQAKVSLDELPRITEYIETTLEEKAVSMATIMKMNIAFDEIFSNIVKFSGATYAKIYCGVEGTQAYLIFEDDGVAYNPLEQEKPDTTLSAEDREIGGLGIFMVKQSMDEMDYKYIEGKNILSLRKKK